MQKFQAFFIFALLFSAFAASSLIFAHGDEDHGETKAKTETTDKGTISHSARLGELELMFKHPFFAPDTATEAQLFVTKFATNEAFTTASTAVEIESENGMITQATVETSETAGVFNIKFPALPDGNYTVRAKMTYSGETDTAVFSGIEVKPQTASATETSGMSWAHTFLIGLIFLIVLALFGALIYFVLHLSVIKEETVSA